MKWVLRRGMKLNLEQISLSADRSFRLLLTPGLNDLYYWHFHPEWEIVYVETETGTRHIGDHISRFQGSDLVLIASNVPHLNFDYGVTADCEQVVIQMSPSFVDLDFFSLPEMHELRNLFESNKGAVAFHGETKHLAASMLREMSKLDGFSQLMLLLDVLQILGRCRSCEWIEARAVESALNFKKQERMKRLHRHVEENFRSKPDSHAAASLVNLSMPAFCRYFKKATGYTYTDYVNKYRIDQARKLLLLGNNVTEACFDCGFENLSHFNRTFRRFAGENPSAFRKRHQG